MLRLDQLDTFFLNILIPPFDPFDLQDLFITGQNRAEKLQPDVENRFKPVAQNRNFVFYSQNIGFPKFDDILGRPGTVIADRPDQLCKKLIKHANLTPNTKPIIPDNTSIPNIFQNTNQSPQRVTLQGNTLNKFFVRRMEKIGQSPSALELYFCIFVLLQNGTN
jgi:hypothetical protein